MLIANLLPYLFDIWLSDLTLRKLTYKFLYMINVSQIASSLGVNFIIGLY